jgi:hypothetical protein
VSGLTSQERADAYDKRQHRRYRLGCFAVVLIVVGLVVVGVIYVARGSSRMNAKAVAVADAFTRSMFIDHDCKTANRFSAELCMPQYREWRRITNLKISSHVIEKNCNFAQGGLPDTLPTTISPDCVRYAFGKTGLLYLVMTNNPWRVASWIGTGA